MNGKKIILEIWDTDGAYNYRSITSSYLRGAKGIILIYDICNRDSFDNLNSWIKFIEEHIIDNICILIVGNNCRTEEYRQVTFKEGKEYAEANKKEFIETSTKENKNVDKAFELLSNKIIEIDVKEKEEEKRKKEVNNNLYTKKSIFK